VPILIRQKVNMLTMKKFVLRVLLRIKKRKLMDKKQIYTIAN